MAGYIRQSSFVDGDTITAALFNDEYNQLLSAFSNTGGHKHDGTAAEGPVIGLIGDAGETAPNNKVLIDTTNNFIEFYVQVSSNPVQQLYIADGAIIPVTDSDVDLGTTSLRFKDTYTDTITTTGNVGIGGNLTVTGTTTFNGGTITMGDAATDNVVFGADIDSNIIPDDDNTYDLGSASQEWRNLYIDGTANIDSLVADTADINGGTVDGAIIGGSSAAAITGTAITGTSFVIGSADISEAELETIDGVTAGTVAASKAVVVDANKDIGSFRNITLTGELDAGSLDVSGNVDVDGTLETDALSINGTTVTSTAAELNILDGVTASAADINLIDGITNGTVIASKAIITDANIDITGGRNITISGELDAATLDISGDADIDGTLEADAITIAGVTLAETISDTVGAMVSSNTESGITVAYDDADNTLDFTVGTLNQDTTGLAGTATALATARTIGGTSFDGTANIAVGLADTATVLATARTIGGVSFNGSANIDLPGVNSAGNQNTSGTAAIATTVTITDNESTNENNAIVFTAGGDLDGGNLGLESDGDLYYNPSTGTLTVPNVSVSGTFSTVNSVTMDANNAVIFEGTTADAHETTLTSIDATGDRTISLPNVSGTIPVLAAASATAITSTPEELNILDGVTSTAAELNILDGVTSTAAELNALDGITAVVGELNALDIGSTAVGTAVASKAVILDSNKDYTGVRNFTLSGELDAGSLDVSGNADIDGTLETDALSINGTTVTSTAAELNILDGVTSTAAELNILDGVTSTAAELNILDGVTSTAAELNALDGITAVVGELNALDIGSTAVGTAVASKAVILDSNKDYTGVRNFTISGELDAATLDISGNVDIDGVLETDNLTIGGAQGSDGQVLTSTGSGVGWEDASGGGSGATFKEEGTNFTNSIMVGDDATGTLDAATGNVGLGIDVFAALTSGDNNVVVGFSAGNDLTTGSRNTALGTNALDKATTPNDNTAIGFAAMTATTTGGANTAVGKRALQTNTTASDNTVVGSSAMSANTEGASNVAVGASALGANTTADSNTAVGYNSLGVNTTGTANAALGALALDATTTGSYNTAIGYGTLTANTTGHDNTALGKNSLAANTTAHYNTAVGAGAMEGCTTGEYNTAVGQLAMDAVLTGNFNTAVGRNSMGANTSGSSNCAVGINALSGNTTGGNNCAMGDSALDANTTASNNTAIGVNALGANTTGNESVAIGSGALASGTTAHNNVAIGYLAANALATTAVYQTRNNVAIGHGALKTQVTQEDNTAIGYNALTAGNSASNSQITAIGSQTGSKAHAAYGGVYVGYQAGEQVTSGVHNTLVGRQAGDNITTGTLNICLGYAAVPSSSGTAEIVIGNNVSGKGNNTGYIYPNGGGSMYQATNATTWAQSSDERIKKNIVDNNDGLNKLKDIQVRNFEYRTEDEITDFDNPSSAVVKKEGLQLGVIAQEIEKVLPEVIRTENTGVKAVNTDNLTWYLINAVQELSAEIKKLKGE